MAECCVHAGLKKKALLGWWFVVHVRASLHKDMFYWHTCPLLAGTEQDILLKAWLSLRVASMPEMAYRPFPWAICHRPNASEPLSQVNIADRCHGAGIWGKSTPIGNYNGSTLSMHTDCPKNDEALGRIDALISFWFGHGGCTRVSSTASSWLARPLERMPCQWKCRVCYRFASQVRVLRTHQLVTPGAAGSESPQGFRLVRGGRLWHASVCVSMARPSDDQAPHCKASSCCAISACPALLRADALR